MEVQLTDEGPKGCPLNGVEKRYVTTAGSGASFGALCLTVDK